MLSPPVGAPPLYRRGRLWWQSDKVNHEQFRAGIDSLFRINMNQTQEKFTTSIRAIASRRARFRCATAIFDSNQRGWN
jgi:hypothetical protein